MQTSSKKQRLLLDVLNVIVIEVDVAVNVAVLVPHSLRDKVPDELPELTVAPDAVIEMLHPSVPQSATLYVTL